MWPSFVAVPEPENTKGRPGSGRSHMRGRNDGPQDQDRRTRRRGGAAADAGRGPRRWRAGIRPRTSDPSDPSSASDARAEVLAPGKGEGLRRLLPRLLEEAREGPEGDPVQQLRDRDGEGRDGAVDQPEVRLQRPLEDPRQGTEGDRLLALRRRGGEAQEGTGRELKGRKVSTPDRIADPG